MLNSSIAEIKPCPVFPHQPRLVMLKIKFTEGPPEVAPKTSPRRLCGRINGRFQAGFGARRSPHNEFDF